MRDGADRVEEESTLNGNLDRNNNSPTKDAPTSGFTAVNGDNHRANGNHREHSKSRQPTRPTINMAMTQDRGRNDSHDHSSSWRPDSGLDTGTPFGLRSPESHHGAKRKRGSHDHGRDSSRRTDRSSSVIGSPKRRMMAPDSGVDLTSPPDSDPPSLVHRRDRSPPDPLPGSVYARERTPTREADAPGPAPQVSSETEKEMAASLRRELHGSEQLSYSRTDQTPSSHLSPRNGVTAIDAHHSETLSPDQLQQNESEAKKRKRNFSNRTKTGCHTCRNRKKKCDERHPICENCERGNFQCAGYGPKPADGRALHSSRTQMPLQSKPHYEPPYGPPGSYPSNEPRYTHWGNVVEPEPPIYRHTDPRAEDPRSFPVRDSYNNPRPTPWPESASSSYPSDSLPPADFHTIPPLNTFTRDIPPPLHEHWHTPSRQSYAPSFAAQQLPPVGYPGSSHKHSGDSASISSSHRGSGFQPGFSSGHLTDKEKMLLGKPFKHFTSSTLIGDREDCMAALERYNNSTKATSGVSIEERGRQFEQILKPKVLRNPLENHPRGDIGASVIIETPFKCDYGYNITIGEGVVVQSGAYFQDACSISIGDHTILGPNVQLLAMTASVDHTKRNGSEGDFIGGAIRIEDNCYIGANVVILPYRTIHAGAVVGAGSVVTKDVPANTVVAGVPARKVRSINPGSMNSEQHRPDIQLENEKMIHRMWADRRYRE